MKKSKNVISLKSAIKMIDELQVYLSEVHNPECCIEDGYEDKCSYCLSIFEAKGMIQKFNKKGVTK